MLHSYSAEASRLSVQTLRFRVLGSGFKVLGQVWALGLGDVGWSPSSDLVVLGPACCLMSRSSDCCRATSRSVDAIYG